MNRALSSAIIGLSAAGFSLISSSAQAAGLFTNGGFVPSNVGSSAFLGSGQIFIPGWEISTAYSFLIPDGTAATTDINQAGYGPDPIWGTQITAPSGGPVSFYGSGPINSADGSGWFVAADGAYGADATFSQMLNGLTVGQQYTVSFYQASAQQREFDGDSNSGWQVIFGNSVLNSATMSHPSQAAVSPWQKQTLTFTADSTNPVLRFLALGSPAGQPPFALLSGVSVEPTSSTPIPTPALLPGLLGMGVAAWRKRKSVSVEGSTES